MSREGGSLRASVRAELDQIAEVVAGHGVQAAVARLDELAARAHRDPAALYPVQVQRGRWHAKINLAAGIAIAREAQQLLVQHPELDHDPAVEADRIFGALQLAILLADDGQLSDALRAITPMVDHLRDADHPQLHVALNYLAQIHLQLGHPPQEDILREATMLDRSQNPGWHSYTMLLYCDYEAQTGPVIDGIDQIASEMVGEIERCQLPNLIPIARNLGAEVLFALAVRIHETDPDTAEGWMRQAREQAMLNTEYARQIGDIRSEIVAATLLSRLAWTGGDHSRAQTEAVRALDLLHRSGGRLPALRAERIFYYCGNMLANTVSVVEAKEAHRWAREEIQRKLRLLDPEHQENFLRIPINQAILETGER